MTTASPVHSKTLVDAIDRLATAIAPLDDATLDNQAWSWGHYSGVRMALIGATQDLDDLAAELLVRRCVATNPPSLAQRLLARHHSAYRDLLALLVGLDHESFTTPPGEGEWPVSTTLYHIYRTEVGFLGTILLGLAAQAEGTQPAVDRDRARQLVAALAPEVAEDASLAEMLAVYETLHGAVVDRVAGFSDAALEARAPFWEPELPAVRFRLGRFTAHLHEHTVQIEKTLAVVNPLNEARRHVRRVYRSLAEVEGALFGAPDLLAETADLAQRIVRRVDGVERAVAGSKRLFEAIKRGDVETARALVAQDRQIANASDENRQPALMTAIYHRQPQIVQALRDAEAEIDLFAAAAVGHLPEIEEHYNWNPKTVNWISRDGYTPLQLACYFGQEDVVRYLLGKGADVHAVSRNDIGIQPIHAAVSGRNAAIVRALIEAGADVDARQASGHTPLQAAQQNGDMEIVTMLEQASASSIDRPSPQ